MATKLQDLEQVRGICRVALALGLLSSLAANVVAAEPTVIGRLVAAWPPLVLLIVVELIGRVSLDKGWLAHVRLATASGIALVSYKHMLEVAQVAGEGSIEAHLIPLTVDGLVIVASISLVGLNQRIRAAAPKTKPQPASRPLVATANGAASQSSLATLSASPTLSAIDGPDRAARAAELAAAGRTQQQIAEQLGVSVRTVRRDLKEVTAA